MFSFPEIIYFTLAFCILWFIYYMNFAVKKTRILHHPNYLFKNEIVQCPSLEFFFPCFFMLDRNIQTVGCKFLRHGPKINYIRKIVSLKDGGSIALDFDQESMGNQVKPDKPLCLILHGMVGSSNSKYVRNTVKTMTQSGFVSVVMNARGCGTSELTSPKNFCAANSEDLREVVSFLKQNFPKAPLFAVTYSLGANTMTKYLGEEGTQVFEGVVCISNPFCFIEATKYLEKSFFVKLYNRFLTKDLRNYFLRHKHVLEKVVDYSQLQEATFLHEIDKAATLKLYNFKSLTEYYETSSSVRVLLQIKTPVLFLNSEDDPVVNHIPYHLSDKNEHLCFAVTQKGGHTAYLKNGKFWGQDRKSVV